MTASLARQSLSSLRGFTRKRANAASRSADSSRVARSPTRAAAAATTRFDLSARLRRSSGVWSEEGGCSRSRRIAASFSSRDKRVAILLSRVHAR